MRTRGAATDNLSDEKQHLVSPLAVCLLLACCDRIKADEQETIEAILLLRRYTPAEQVRSWALLCSDNDINPNQVQHPAAPAPGEGVECRGCQHLGLGWVHRPGVRRVFRFVCDRQHALLELGYAGERVLITKISSKAVQVNPLNPHEYVWRVFCCPTPAMFIPDRQ